MRHIFSCVIIALLLGSSPLLADEAEKTETKKKAKDPSGLSAKLQAAAKDVEENQTFELRYRMTKGEVVRWKVTHLATVFTRIKGTEATEKTRSVSTKAWEISNVDGDGNFTFVNLVENVEMWQSVPGRDDVRYNSTTDVVAPRQYENVAKSLGTPLATITMNCYGRVTKRENVVPNYNTAIGELTVPLPEQPVKIGAQWRIPDELRANLDGGRIMKIQTQQVYRLEKIEAGIATISIRTQPITPINDPKVESQILEHLKNGTVKFDMDAGRLLFKQMDLDKEIIGFQGAESLMQYLARLTEEFITKSPEPAAVESAKKATEQK